jgi:hypothetical protein
MATKKTFDALVYDNNGNLRAELVTRLESVKVATAPTFKPLEESDFKDAMACLHARLAAARNKASAPKTKCVLDSCDILIVDFDLLGSEAGEFLTGEEVAYLARCWSECGIIVGVNRYHAVDFDLTLRGHVESFADLNVNDKNLANGRLWGVAVEGFAPWNWYSVTDATTRFNDRVDEIEKNLDKPILKTLEFPDDIVAVIPKGMASFLGKDLTTVTFRDFATSSDKALRRHDAGFANDKIVARICASRVSKWLENMVLPAQSILVDAPHLVARFPSLMKGSKKPSDWNAVCDWTTDDKCEQLASVAKYRFMNRKWLSRPAWFWPALSEDESIPEVAQPWADRSLPFEFCEDASRFIATQDCTDFVADVESPFVQRYIKKFSAEGQLYSPEIRLAL